MFGHVISITVFIVGFCLPLEGAAMSVGVAYLSASKFAALILLMVGLLQFSLTREMPGMSKVYWMMVYAVSAVVGSVYAFLKDAPIGTLVNHMMAYPGLFALVVLLGSLLRDLRLLNRFLISLCAGMIVATFLAFLGVESTNPVEGVQRLGGVAGNANEVAFHLTLTVAIALSFWFTERNYLRRMIAIGIAIYFVACMVATVSRSGLLAFITMMFFWILRYRRLDMLKFALPVVVAAPMFLFMLAPEEARQRVSSLDGSAYGRLLQYRVGAEAFISNPVIGVGPRRFIDFAQERGYRLVNTVHNMGLKLLSENGLLGFIPFMAIVLLSWRNLSRTYWISRHVRVRGDPLLSEVGLRAAFLQIGMVGMAVIGQVQPMIDDKLMWALFGCSTAVDRIARDRLRVLLAREGEDAPEGGREMSPAPGYGSAHPQPASPL